MRTKLYNRKEVDNLYDKSRKKTEENWEEILRYHTTIFAQLSQHNIHHHRVHLKDYSLTCQEYIKNRLISLGYNLSNITYDYCDVIWGTSMGGIIEPYQPQQLPEYHLITKADQ